MCGAVMALSVPVAASASAEAPGVAAKRFVDRIYGLAKPYVSEDATYTPALAKLIAQASVVAGKTDDMDLVGDAFCDCQDITLLKARTTLVSATASAATVRVRLTGGEQGPETYLIQLTRLPAGWRVADTISPGDSSYVRYLQAAIRGK